MGAKRATAGWFGSLARRLLRKAPCAVWVVRAKHAGKRVVAAIDPAPGDPEREHLAVRVLHAAITAAIVDRAELHVLHAWEVDGRSIPGWLYTAKTVDEHVRVTEARVTEFLDRFLQPYSPYIPRDRCHQFHGDAATVITSFARHEAVDLLVMGAHAYNGVPGLLIGDTAELVIDQVPSSLLFVKPAHASESVDLAAELKRLAEATHGGFAAVQEQIARN
jgi:nucleotide-binding universal stress UspA family protein